MQRGQRGGRELNLEGLEMRKCNIPTDRAQRVDKKNGLIFLVIKFAPELWSLKCHSYEKIFRCI